MLILRFPSAIFGLRQQIITTRIACPCALNISYYILCLKNLDKEGYYSDTILSLANILINLLFPETLYFHNLGLFGTNPLSICTHTYKRFKQKHNNVPELLRFWAILEILAGKYYSETTLNFIIIFQVFLGHNNVLKYN